MIPDCSARPALPCPALPSPAITCTQEHALTHHVIDGSMPPPSPRPSVESSRKHFPQCLLITCTDLKTEVTPPPPLPLPPGSGPEVLHLSPSVRQTTSRIRVHLRGRLWIPSPLPNCAVIPAAHVTRDTFSPEPPDGQCSDKTVTKLSNIL